MAEKKLEPVSEKRTVIYEVVRVLAQIVFHTIMPVRFHHRERLDRERPFIMIANHNHALDPVPMAMAVKHDQVVFLGKKELGSKPWIRMEAMRACMKAIKMKKVLLIFPEGTRHHEGQMEHIEAGTALIAMRSKAPVIPIYFDRKLKPFRITNLYVGEEIPYDDLLERGINAETCEEMNERMRGAFRNMIRNAEK